jgi:hypothetical protein
MLRRRNSGKKVAPRLLGRRAVLGSCSIGRQRFGSAAAGRRTRHGLARLGQCRFFVPRERDESAYVVLLRGSPRSGGLAEGSWHSWLRVRAQGSQFCAGRSRARAVICAWMCLYTGHVDFSRWGMVVEPSKKNFHPTSPTSSAHKHILCQTHKVYYASRSGRGQQPFW